MYKYFKKKHKKSISLKKIFFFHIIIKEKKCLFLPQLIN